MKIFNFENQMTIVDFIKNIDIEEGANIKLIEKIVPHATMNLILESLSFLGDTEEEMTEEVAELMEKIEFVASIDFDKNVVKCRRGMCKIEDTGLSGLEAGVTLNSH